MPQLFIDAVDDQLLFERCESFAGGMDVFTRSTLLPQDTTQYLENALVEANLEARTRPGADALGNRTIDGGGNAPLQGLAYFDKTNTQRILSAKGGNFWKWDGAAWTAANGWTIDPAGSFVAAQGVDKLLLSDAVNTLHIWDGANFTDVGPTGPTAAAYIFWAVGRMWACGFPGTGGAGLEYDALWPSLELAFDANSWIKTDSLRIGGGEGDPVVCGSALPTSALTSFLICIFKRNSVWLVNADPTQKSAAWAVLQLTPGVGIVGKKAFCQFGNDLLFMARDGVRSVRRMQSAAGQFETSPPMSQPMQPYIDRINWSYASGIVATRYKEFALFAVPLDNSTVNNYVLVYNGRLNKWIGFWTNWTPVALDVSRFNALQQLIIADTTGRVNLWKDQSTRSADSTYTDNGVYFVSKLWIRSCSFQDLINPKDGYFAEVRFTDGNANLTISAVADNVINRSWPAQVAPVGPVLPIALNFVLGGGKPTTIRRSLRGLVDFNEVYLRIESTQGWWQLRNVTLAAFLNMLDDAP